MEQKSILHEAEFHKAYQELIEAINITASEDPDIKEALLEMIEEVFL